jgi:probable phosphoglycerate mutase
MPVLYFIRHGETDWNREGRLQGQTETDINPRGEAQAAMAARNLVDPAFGAGFAARLSYLPFIASPMQRTRRTMEILRAALGLETTAYSTDDRLKELGFGAWEGKTWKEVKSSDAKGAAGRDADKWGFVPPGGESYAMLRQRVAGWQASITEDCVVVGHGGVARVLMVMLAGASPKDAVGADVWQGKVLRFRAGRADWIPGPGHH